jgi:hypothetical protein
MPHGKGSRGGGGNDSSIISSRNGIRNSGRQEAAALAAGSQRRQATTPSESTRTRRTTTTSVVSSSSTPSSSTHGTIQSELNPRGESSVQPSDGQAVSMHNHGSGSRRQNTAPSESTRRSTTTVVSSGTIPSEPDPRSASSVKQSDGQGRLMRNHGGGSRVGSIQEPQHVSASQAAGRPFRRNDDDSGRTGGGRLTHVGGVRNTIPVLHTTTTTIPYEESHNHGSGNRNSTFTSSSSSRSTWRSERTPSWWSSQRPQQVSEVHPYGQRQYDAQSAYPYDDERPRWGLVCSLCCWFSMCIGSVLSALFGLLCGLCCLRCGPSEHTPSRDAAVSFPPTSSPSSSCRISSGIVFAVGCLLSIMIWVGMVSVSTQPSNSMNIDDGSVWFLVPGETRRVYLPLFVRGVRVTVVDGTSPQVEAAVFRFTNGCPNLKGPKVTIQHDSEFDLPGGGFEFDYYNLYPGSTVSAQFQQLDGTSFFYLLRGEEMLYDLQTGTNIDPARWEAEALVKRRLTPSSSRSSNVFYRVPPPNNDIYILLYDNGSEQRFSSFDVQSDLELTTFDLRGATPRCDNMRWWKNGGDSCRVSASQNDCLVLEAFSTSSSSALSLTDESEQNNNTVATNLHEEQVVALRVEAIRHWAAIWLWSGIPVALATIFCTVRMFVMWCCSQCSASVNVESGGLDEPLLSTTIEGNEYNVDEVHRPPPLNPQHILSPSHPTPTAPPDE